MKHSRCRATSVAALLAALMVTANAGAESKLDGVWSQSRGGGRHPLASEGKLTPAGQAKWDEYDPLHDDSSLECIPPSIARIMQTPNNHIEIRTYDDHVEIDYEAFMDVYRRLKLDPDVALEDAQPSVPEYPSLGRSKAYWEGDELVIESAGFAPGIITSLNQRAGIPRSEQMWTEERFMLDGDVLTILVKHVDPAYWEEPLVLPLRYRRSDNKLFGFGCDPDAASVYRNLKEFLDQ